MVAAVRRGMSQRAAAIYWGVPLSTVQHWLRRAGQQRLDRVSWDDLPTLPRSPSRTPRRIETRVLTLRRKLQKSVLGEVGAVAIHRELQAANVTPCPSVRTIGRILERHGVLDGRRRVRRPPPPKGWYLPAVASQSAEIDSFDTIEGLAIRGGTHLCILTAVSVLAGIPGVWPRPAIAATDVVSSLVEHWRQFGLPHYAQFDNDNRFTGPRQHPDAIGRVIRLCLSLGITPVFAPPNETGFQAAIESFNGLWQAKVWQRYEYQSLRQLQQRSGDYVTALRKRRATRMADAPVRRPFPSDWKLNLQASLTGTMIFLRRTNADGQTNILGHPFQVDPLWTHRLVRAEVILDQNVIQFFALRRRQHDQQPLLNTVTYRFPNRKFLE